jgi:uncharacterized protein
MTHPRARSPHGAPREHWPWLLATGPAVVVVASLASAVIAASGSDGLVADDYYKLGLTINRRLPAATPSTREPAADIAIAADGDVRVRLLQPAGTPSRVRLALRHPGEREGARTVELRAAGDEWVGRIADLSPGLRIVSLESDTWRFPVTIVERLPAAAHVGAPQPGS